MYKLFIREPAILCVGLYAIHVLLRCAITRQEGNTAPDVLNSWKEIANYLERGVRTAQRWERDLHLPVHRIGNGKKSPVFAHPRELRFWMETCNGVSAQYKPAPAAKPRPTLVVRQPEKPIENARRLLSAAKDLAQQIAETSVRQRRQAEDLQARILRIRARLK